MLAEVRVEAEAVGLAEVADAGGQGGDGRSLPGRAAAVK
jgi:hypothetical protein